MCAYVVKAYCHDSTNEELREECAELQQRLAADKETLNNLSEELGIIIRYLFTLLAGNARKQLFVLFFVISFM